METLHTKAIKNIVQIKPMLCKYKNQEHYVVPKGVLIIEFEDDSRRILDIANEVDVSDYEDYRYYLDPIKSKIKYIFKGDTSYYSNSN